jgi:sulfoxide reductase heme-binding subunit YedZ
MTSQHNPPRPTMAQLASAIRVLLILGMLYPLLTLLELKSQAEPAKFLLHDWGRAGFLILCGNLIAGSLWELGLRRLTQARGWNEIGPQFLKLRRHSGVISFFWLTAHAMLLIVLEAGWIEAGQALAQALYLQLALAGWLCLATLALSSNNLAQRRLGKSWRRLHRLSYPAFSLGLAHTLLIEKADLLFFGTWGAAVVALWILRGIQFWVRLRRVPHAMPAPQ